MTPRTPCIGILGGQGCLASAVFAERIARNWPLCQPCATDADFPRMLHWSESLPGLGLKGLHDKDLALRSLVGRALDLKSMGTCFIALPCNSLSPLALPLSQAVGLPVHTPLTCASSEQLKQPWRVLCSSTTSLTLHEFGPGLNPSGAAEQTAVDEAIAWVVAGRYAQAKALITEITVKAQTKSKSLLACTELSCLGLKGPNVVDTLDWLLDKTLAWACSDKYSLTKNH